MSQNSPEVVAIGTLAVDYFALVPKIPAEDEKLMAQGYEIHPGGVAGNVLTQLARLRVRAGWFGKIGDDEAGKILIREFQKEGVDTSHTEVVEGDYSMFTWIQVDRKGSRSITMFPNALVKLTDEDVSRKHGDYIAGAKALHAEACLLPLRPVLRAMEIARANGVKIIFDLDVPPSHFADEAGLASRDEIFRALELSDVLIPCKSAARELIGSEDIAGGAIVDGAIFDGAKKLLEYGPRTVAITLGDKGCIAFDRERFFSTPAFRVKVVDTTGAGDAFHGGFIYSVLNGLSLKDASIFANACGAICCTKVGARAMGTLQEVRALIDGSQRA